YFPKLCPPLCGLEINFRRIRTNPLITVLTGATPTRIGGGPGAYTAEMTIEPRFVTEACTACGDCEKACPIEVDDPFNWGLKKVKAIRLPHELAFPYRFMMDKSAASDPRMAEAAKVCKPNAVKLGMKPEPAIVQAKSVIWATGWEPYDASLLEGLNFGKLPNVITNMTMERMAAPNGHTGGKISRSSDGAPIAKAAFVQCAGSRDEKHLPYCSAVCCMASLKQSRYIREQYPEAELHIFFIDARTPGRHEDFYQMVQDDPKTIIHRGKVAKIEEAGDGAVMVIAENTLTGKLEKVTVDLAVLATGMKPVATEIPILKGSLDQFGFISGNGKSTWIAAGVAAAPKDVASTNEEATGAVACALKQMAGKCHGN
ncbi:MAG: heterodisulfide reductase subunit A, partial [Calditrichota bacterium]